MMLGLRTTIYHVDDLEKAKHWYSRAFGAQPYFDEPFYVGFNVGGYELGLNPDVTAVRPGPGGALPYWGVVDIDAAVRKFVDMGAQVTEPAHEVGQGIKVATVADPFGNLIGLIENPHFNLPGA
jgi:predicted enzyme related to lactoylglutathione lyase